MKTRILSVLFLLLMGAALIPAIAGGKDKISVTRNVSGFSSIRLEAVGNIIFTQSPDYSLRMEGPSEYVNKTTTRVEKGTLVIDYENGNCNSKNVRIYISAPDLKSMKFEGVGSFNAKKLILEDVVFDMEGVGSVDVADLQCRNLRINAEGVGNVDMNITCKKVKVNAEGVGHVKLTGTAGKAEITKDGIGGVNTRGLVIGQ